MNLLDDAQRRLDNDDVDGAVDAAALAFWCNEDPARAARIAGRGMQWKRAHDEAILWFNESIGRRPEAYTFARRAWSYYMRSEDALAMADYASAIALDEPAMGFAWYGRGRIHLNASDFPRAEDAFDRAVHDSEWGAKATYYRGLTHAYADRPAAAEHDFAAATERGEQDAVPELLRFRPDTSSWSGAALSCLAAYLGSQSERDLNREQAICEQALAVSADAAKHDIFIQLGFVLVAQRRHGDAAAAFLQAAERQPRGTGRTLAGRTLYLADDNRGAERLLKEALDCAAKPYEAHHTLGQLCAEENRLQEALAYFDCALRSAGASISRVESSRGRVLLSLGRKEEAKRALLAAEIAGDEEAGDVRRQHFGADAAEDYFQLAIEAMNAGDYQGSRAPLHEAARLFRERMRAPGDLAARNLANVLNNFGFGPWTGDVQERLALLEEAHRARPLWPTARTTLGIVLRGLGRQAESLAAHDEAVSVALGDPRVHYNRGIARMAARMAREAADDFRKALAYEAPVARQDALFNLVKSLWKAGLFEEARAACIEGRIVEDADTAAQVNIASMLKRGGVYEGNNRMVDRIVSGIDYILAAPRGQGRSYPFRFYGVSPGAWAEGANMHHVYRVCFRDAPSADTKARIATAVAQPWKYIEDDGSTWLWSGRFAQLNLGERRSNARAFFEEVQAFMTAIHEVAPLEEVVALNAEWLSEEPWEDWSLGESRLPLPHPYPEDGQFFFSAYGDTSQLSAPLADPAFDAALIASRPERDDDMDDDDMDDDDMDDDDMDDDDMDDDDDNAAS
jgi:Flp pilus assembly protein TadD